MRFTYAIAYATRTLSFKNSVIILIALTKTKQNQSEIESQLKPLNETQLEARSLHMYVPGFQDACCSK